MRRTHWTIILICEGTAELQYATTIRDCYLSRNCGTVLQPQNAHGGGGKKSLWMARSLQSQTAHDAYGILIDTDEHWADEDRVEAKRAGIVVIENTPCLEAILLRIGGNRISPKTKENKEAFEKEYGGPAHTPNLIKKYFPKSKFEAARSAGSALDEFLRLIRC